MKKLLAVLLTLLMTCLLAVIPVAAETVEPVVLNVAYMPNYASLWLAVTGIHQGYFSQQGLELRLVEFADGPTIIAAMENGSIDIGFIGPGAHKLCINGRAKVFCLSQISNADAVMASRKAGISAIPDLKGKKVGYASGTSSEMILQYALEDAALTWEDIIPYEMDASSLFTAMLSGALDACACWSPATSALVEHGGGDIFALCTNIDFADRSVALESWIVLSGYYEKHSERIEKFTRALYQAMDFGSQEKNFPQVAQWVAEQCATEVEVALSQTGDADWPSRQDVLDLIESGRLAEYYRTQQLSFIASGAIEHEVPVTDYILFDNMINAAR